MFLMLSIDFQKNRHKIPIQFMLCTLFLGGLYKVLQSTFNQNKALFQVIESPKSFQPQNKFTIVNCECSPPYCDLHCCRSQLIIRFIKNTSQQMWINFCKVRRGFNVFKLTILILKAACQRLTFLISIIWNIFSPVKYMNSQKILKILKRNYVRRQKS